MSLVNTQVEFIRYAQEQYQEAINKQNAEWANFWLGHLHKLCQQMYWLESAANMHSPAIFATNKLTTQEQKEIIEQLKSTAAIMPDEIVSVPPLIKPKPSSYNWDDGFQGVKLSNAWEDEEETDDKA